VRDRCAAIVSDFFRDQLLAHERVRVLLEEIRGT